MLKALLRILKQWLPVGIILLFTLDRGNNYTYFTKITHVKEVLYLVYPIHDDIKIGYAHSQYNFSATCTRTT